MEQKEQATVSPQKDSPRVPAKEELSQHTADHEHSPEASHGLNEVHPDAPEQHEVQEEHSIEHKEAKRAREEEEKRGKHGIRPEDYVMPGAFEVEIHLEDNQVRAVAVQTIRFE